MDDIEMYFTSLIGKIYKLLPMREDYDFGVENYLPAYVNNLFRNLCSYKAYYPGLEHDKRFVDVYSNLLTLRDVTMPFDMWRSVVLRSTRLVEEIARDRAERSESPDA